MKIIECVPNFSEGVDLEIIKKITNEIEQVKNVQLLDVDPGKDTNRTVVTFIGNPEEVIEAAFNSIKKASELIDMRKHQGEHPRMGATDVCPIVPIANTTMQECIKYSTILAKRVGDELKIPVFLYEESSSKADRKNLANIRKGEYEGMSEKLKSSKWTPDFGPNIMNEKSGVTAIGARNYLIAYNVNLNTKDKKIATDIALDIREAGRARRDSSGKILRYKDGSMKKKPGTLKHVKAVGWFIDEYGKAQVSINLINYMETSIYKVFEEIRNQARKRGLRVTGSEIVGLVPKKSLIDTGIYYLKKQNRPISIPDKEIIHIAIESLGLNDISDFNQNSSIIENRLVGTNSKLKDFTLHDFINEVSIDSPAPGGGSVSALVGGLSSALISMVSNLSYNKKGYEKHNFKFEEIGSKAQNIKRELIRLVDEDTEAFNMIMEAFKMPKKTKEDRIDRSNAIEKATKNAIETPLLMMKLSLELLKLSKQIAKIGNKNSLSDAGVASEMAFSSINGAYMNVLINLKDITDTKYSENIIKKSNLLIEKSKKEIDLARNYIHKKI